MFNVIYPYFNYKSLCPTVYCIYGEKYIYICFSLKTGRSDMTLWLDIMYICKNIIRNDISIVSIVTVWYCYNCASHWIQFYLFTYFLVGLCEGIALDSHTHNQLFLPTCYYRPMLTAVLYLLYLFQEQSPHRLINIETSVGWSCVQISLDLCSHV